MPALNLDGYRLAPAHLTTPEEVRANARRVLERRGFFVAPKPKPPVNNSIDWKQIGGAVPTWNFSLPETDRIRFKDESPVYDPPSVLHIQKAMCGAARITVEEIRSVRRLDRLVVPRQLAMAIAHRLTSQSYPELGRRFGGRDHTTALHAVQKMAPVMAVLEPIIETTPLDQLAKLALEHFAKIRPPSPRMRGTKVA